jgi:hypothetical protein
MRQDASEGMTLLEFRVISVIRSQWLPILLLPWFLTIAMPGNKLLRMLGALSGVAFQVGCLRNDSFSSCRRVF